MLQPPSNSSAPLSYKVIPQQNYVKVQFFEDAILMTVRDQMNKFFEQEKISKDRIVEIKYIKDRDRYSVMVVYV